MDTLPNLIVIGGPRTGSTSLHYYLSLHPEIFMSGQKELNFFVDEVKGPTRLEWYRSQFSAGGKFKIRGETSPNYTCYPRIEGVPGRMHSVVPDAKLIYLLRDPIERMLSHFTFMAPDQDIKRPLEEVLVPLDSNPYVAPSRQCWQVEQYLPYYPLSRILLIKTEDLRRRRIETLRHIFRYLEVDDTVDTREFSLELHTTEQTKRYRSVAGKLIKAIGDSRISHTIQSRFGMPIRHLVPIRNALLKALSPPVEPLGLTPALKSRLLEVFSDDVQRLRALTGLPFDGWCV